MSNRRSHTKSRAGCLQCKRRKVKLWSRDLELMHHFCTVTAHTICARHEAMPIWSVVLPREGYRHNYLLRGILSTAAIHKAFLLPNQRKTYLMLSDYHQAIGLEGYRAQLQHIDDQNWEAMFGFAMLMVLYVMCMPVRSETQRLEDPITSMIELIGVVRGIHSSLSPLTPRLYNSQYAPLIYGTWPQDINKVLEEERPSLEFTRLPPDTYDALDELVSFLESSLTSHSEKHYLGAVEMLRRTVKLVAKGGLYAECSAVFSWPSGIHQSIILDIRNRNPHALVIVAYVAIVMASLEESFWYFRGWAKPLVKEIEMLLEKHDRHLQLLEWPKAHIKKVYG
ncbi:hypothetical protein B0J13DRAFT_588639 [Dactylonectria estremocensis]|uniref:C6 zinc finger domain-containing protein n=1 Tax=Dactylonectria estremocensis TaxID=1079267 RepID=A0A9P9DYU4_9HYPO|nr:hypothetical protein B0J13DRAFT_588639 [Dactylonectria estremocensis]